MSYSPAFRTFLSGVGFLSDAYDLFILNLVKELIEAEYPEGNTPEEQAKYRSIESSELATAALVGAVIGQLVFGALADQLGRRTIFVVTLSCVTVGAFLSAACIQSSSFSIYTQLVLCRLILGFGVGGEYPLSATVTSEHASTTGRGSSVSSVFAMQGVGNLLAAVMTYIVLAAGVPRDAAWRILLAIGGVPGLLTVYWRYKLEESEVYLRDEKRATYRHEHPQAGTAVEIAPLTDSPDVLVSPASSPAAAAAVAAASSVDDKEVALKPPSPPPEPATSAGDPVSVVGHWFREHRWRIERAAAGVWSVRWVLAGTAMNWLLFDIAFYANGLFSGKILQATGVGSPTDLKAVALAQIIVTALALPGYLLAIVTIERIGRWRLQFWGFLAVAALFTVLAIAWPTMEKSAPAAFITVYGLTFLFSNWGPNTTTYVIPAEAFPTRVRATCHGISAASGKLGAVIGAGLLPLLMNAWGEKNPQGLTAVLVACAVVLVAGAVWTWFFTSETSGVALDALDTAAGDGAVEVEELESSSGTESDGAGLLTAASSPRAGSTYGSV